MDEIEVYHREADLCEQSNPLSCLPGLQMPCGDRAQVPGGSGRPGRQSHPAPARLLSEGSGGRLLMISLSLLLVFIRPPARYDEVQVKFLVALLRSHKAVCSMPSFCLSSFVSNFHFFLTFKNRRTTVM